MRYPGNLNLNFLKLKDKMPSFWQTLQISKSSESQENLRTTIGVPGVRHWK